MLTPRSGREPVEPPAVGPVGEMMLSASSGRVPLDDDDDKPEPAVETVTDFGPPVMMMSRFSGREPEIVPIGRGDDDIAAAGGRVPTEMLRLTSGRVLSEEIIKPTPQPKSPRQWLASMFGTEAKK